MSKISNFLFVTWLSLLAVGAAYKVRNRHFGRHTPSAVGTRYGRSVGQILRRLETERGLRYA